MNEPLTIIVVDCLRAKRVDVHGFATDEVLYPAKDKRWAARIIRTIMCRLALIADKLRAANRTVLYKRNSLSPSLS